MQLKVLLPDLQVYARHGVHAREQTQGQRFMVSVAATLTDVADALKHDAPAATIDYDLLRQETIALMQQPAMLLEHLAYRIAKSLLTTHTRMQSIFVRIQKPAARTDNPYTAPYSAAVELLLSREEL